jgi:hypothetical protein
VRNHVRETKGGNVLLKRVNVHHAVDRVMSMPPSVRRAVDVGVSLGIVPELLELEPGVSVFFQVLDVVCGNAIGDVCWESGHVDLR